MFGDEPNSDWQSDRYVDAREKFLAACRDAGVELRSYLHPIKGPCG